jgi:hypothetical protein
MMVQHRSRTVQMDRSGVSPMESTPLWGWTMDNPGPANRMQRSPIDPSGLGARNLEGVSLRIPAAAPMSPWGRGGSELSDRSACCRGLCC